MEFKHGNITLIHGDCMEYMQQMDWKADLAIVDPPYGIEEDGSKNHTRGNKKAKARKYKPFAGNDKSIPDAQYFESLFSVSKNQIIWGGNYMVKHLESSMGWIFWDKDVSADFSDGELAYTSFKKALKKFYYPWSGFRQGDMKNKEDRIHPTQKPVALYKWLLTNYAKKGDRILDTHGGSMSIAIACHDLGFELVCIEKDLYYFNAAVKRFKQHVKQSAIQFPDQLEQPTQTTLQL
ncbi:COG0863 DNA modification methylase [uncultured Caudovirales phage]|uniref:COG0863 DNA modification methylase n=1 Tax=uncultured Caudovirales phage TaxID=2100421 RepID=A0A6J7X4N3_9CAUD|nr:COG0863 DNA modification methylase [uncultured Caudovirales phage]